MKNELKKNQGPFQFNAKHREELKRYLNGYAVSSLVNKSLYIHIILFILKDFQRKRLK